MDTLARETTLSSVFLPPLSFVVYLNVYSKRKEFTLLGGTFFHLEIPPFPKEFIIKESKQEVTEVVSH